jgi:hypothetical protein
VSVAGAGTLVDHLVGLGLVSTIPTQGHQRFWLRDAVRSFVAERAEDGLLVAKDQHAVVMARLVAEATRQTSADPRMLADLSAELGDDLRAAVRHLRERDPATAAVFGTRLRAIAPALALGKQEPGGSPL